MIWSVHYLVTDLARLLTLEPGDLILSGAPANSRPVAPGDSVVVEVGGPGRTGEPGRGRQDARICRMRRATERFAQGARRGARGRGARVGGAWSLRLDAGLGDDLPVHPPTLFERSSAHSWAELPITSKPAASRRARLRRTECLRQLEIQS